MDKSYRRTLLADSPKAGDGNSLYALELYHNDGSFVVPLQLLAYHTACARGTDVESVTVE